MVALSVLVGLLAALGVIPVPGAGPGMAGAHTDLLQGSPGPNQASGGTIDFVDLVFAAPVTEVQVQVTGPDEQIVPGSMEIDEGQIIRHEMSELTEPGRYVVRYQMVSDDGDFTEGGYFFTYDPTAFQPTRLGQVDVQPEDGDLTRRIALVVLVVALVGMCVLLAIELRRRRSALAELRQR